MAAQLDQLSEWLQEKVETQGLSNQAAWEMWDLARAHPYLDPRHALEWFANLLTLLQLDEQQAVMH